MGVDDRRIEKLPFLKLLFSGTGIIAVRDASGESKVGGEEPKSQSSVR